MEARREKDLVKRYSLQLKEDKAREKEVGILDSVADCFDPYKTEVSVHLAYPIIPIVIGEEEEARGELEAAC